MINFLIITRVDIKKYTLVVVVYPSCSPTATRLFATPIG